MSGPPDFGRAGRSGRLAGHGRAARVDQPTGIIGLDVYRALEVGDLDLARERIEAFIAGGGDPRTFYAGAAPESAPFCLWARSGRRELLEVLAPHGIRWNLWSAVAWGEVAEVGAALEREPRLIGARAWCGTPLHWALVYGQVEVARELLRRGEIDLAATEGEGYVRCAARSHRDAAVRFAVEAGAGVDYDPGETALAQQCKQESVACVATLLELGADPNHPRQGDGRSPLHLAVSTGGARELLWLLLEAGGDPHLPDSQGRTPLDVARVARRRTAQRTLEAYLAERGEARESAPPPEDDSQG